MLRIGLPAASPLTPCFDFWSKQGPLPKKRVTIWICSLRNSLSLWERVGSEGLRPVPLSGTRAEVRGSQPGAPWVLSLSTAPCTSSVSAAIYLLPMSSDSSVTHVPGPYAGCPTALLWVDSYPPTSLDNGLFRYAHLQTSNSLTSSVRGSFLHQECAHSGFPTAELWGTGHESEIIPVLGLQQLQPPPHEPLH